MPNVSRKTRIATIAEFAANADAELSTMMRLVPVKVRDDVRALRRSLTKVVFAAADTIDPEDSIPFPDHLKFLNPDPPPPGLKDDDDEA